VRARARARVCVSARALLVGLVAENKTLRKIEETFLVLKRDGFISVVKTLPFNLLVNCAGMTEDVKHTEWSKITGNAELWLSNILYNVQLG
jgi:hypothetical protein